MLPPNFKFPKCNVQTLWDLWWLPSKVVNPETGSEVMIKPYHTLEARDLPNAHDRDYFYKARKVVASLVQSAVEFNYVEAPENINFLHRHSSVIAMDVEARDNMFRHCFEEMYKSFENYQSARVGELNYLTVYDIIMKLLKKQQRV